MGLFLIQPGRETQVFSVKWETMESFPNFFFWFQRTYGDLQMKTMLFSTAVWTKANFSIDLPVDLLLTLKMKAKEYGHH